MTNERSQTHQGGDLDLPSLRFALEKEIAEYAHELGQSPGGLAQSHEWARKQLAELRGSLVDPVWRAVLIRDSACQITGEEPAELRPCVLCADDRRGHELYFDPVIRGYVLAYSGKPPATLMVRGSAVACFMAR